MVRPDFNLSEFEEYISDKKCICFGAGLQGLHIIYLFENWKLTDNILAFVDNDPEKWNSFYEVENYSYPILRLEDTLKLINKNVALIITCADVMGIVQQLEKYKEFQNTICLSLTEIAQMQLLKSDYEKVVCESQTPLIPKKIHYSWFGGDMPKPMRDRVQRWRELCPDYEFYEWNEKNTDVSKSVYMSEAYKAKKWGFVPDYIRLDSVYKYGGIYMDTDVELLQRPDALLYQNAFAISDGSFFINLGAGFGAEPNFPIIKEWRDYYNDLHFIKPDGKLDLTACQIHQYRVLRKYNIRLADVMQKIGGINMYPMIMASTNTYSMQMKESEKAFFAHYGVSSWMSEKHKEHKKKMRSKDVKGLINYGFD